MKKLFKFVGPSLITAGVIIAAVVFVQEWRKPRICVEPTTANAIESDWTFYCAKTRPLKDCVEDYKILYSCSYNRAGWSWVKK